ncbi:hypothetical protein MKY48_03995 [Paenibacillus sp. FSL W8-0187]|uniref:GMP synthase (glutamine-hydrolyzing) n=1 Tax=Paenibacillus sp. FSL W8-0187 TaxID=2921710 RepID=UPI0030DBC8F4
MANWVRIHWDIPEKTSVRIVNEVDNVNHVIYQAIQKEDTGHKMSQIFHVCSKFLP